MRKEFNDLTQITDKNTIIDKIFKIDDKNYQYVGKFLHNLLEKYKEEFTDKNTIIDKIFKIDDKNYQYVGKFLHNVLEKYKEEFDRIIVNS